MTASSVDAAPEAPARRALAAVAAATALNLPFGTIYAFSVFLAPMEAMLGVGRAQMSFVFGLATVTLTVGMNVAPALYRRIPPGWLLGACALLGAGGLALAATATSLAQLAVGYGVLFGFAGGVGFIVVQQGVNQTVDSSRGLVNGYVVALYPLGAMIGAPLFGWAIAAAGLRATLGALAASVLACTLAAAVLLRVARVRMHDASAPVADAGDRHWGVFARLFTVFLLAASAGLTVMSQSAGILQAYGARSVFAIGATTLITGAIAAARLGGGWLVDRFPVARVAVGAHLWSLAGALALAAWPGPWIAVPALAMIGMGYGFVSGLTVGAIAQVWHRNSFGLVAGRMYIAWCAAAVSLPVLAGWIYDRTHGYGGAVLIAAAGNVVGAILASGLPSRRTRVN